MIREEKKDALGYILNHNGRTAREIQENFRVVGKRTHHDSRL